MSLESDRLSSLKELKISSPRRSDDKQFSRRPTFIECLEPEVGLSIPATPIRDFKTPTQVGCEGRRYLRKEQEQKLMDLPFTFHPEVLPATKQRLPPIGSKRPQDALRVVLTGAASDIGQKLTVLVCRGEAFGPKRFVEIVLVDKPRKLRQLREVLVPQIGQSMLPLVAGLYCTHDLAEVWACCLFSLFCSNVYQICSLATKSRICLRCPWTRFRSKDDFFPFKW